MDADDKKETKNEPSESDYIQINQAGNLPNDFDDSFSSFTDSLTLLINIEEKITLKDYLEELKQETSLYEYSSIFSFQPKDNGKKYSLSSIIQVTIKNNDHITELLNYISECEKLSCINFRDIIDINLIEFNTFIINLPESISRITISDCNFTSQQLDNIFFKISKCNLKRFIISNTIEYDIFSDIICGNILSNLKLTHLELSNCGIDDETLVKFNLTNITTLEVLNLSKNKLSSEALDTLSILIQNNSQTLYTIHLSHNSIGASTDLFEKFINTLQNSKVAKLYLDYNKLTPNEFSQLVTWLKKSNNCRNLNVEGNPIGNGILRLPSNLNKLKVNNLELNLRNTFVTNRDLLQFGDSLSKNKNSNKKIQIKLSQDLMEPKTISHLSNSNLKCKNINIDLDINTKNSKQLDYDSKSEKYNRVTLVLLGEYKLLKENINKSADNKNYDLYCFNSEEYTYFGRLIQHCGQSIYIITEDINNHNLISRLNYWISLLIANVGNKFSLIIVINAKENTTQVCKDKIIIQIHNFITDLSYYYQKIDCCNFPILINNIKIIDNKVFKDFIEEYTENNFIYHPKNLISKLFDFMQNKNIADRKSIIQAIKHDSSTTEVEIFFDNVIKEKILYEIPNQEKQYILGSTFLNEVLLALKHNFTISVKENDNLNEQKSPKLPFKTVESFIHTLRSEYEYIFTGFDINVLKDYLKPLYITDCNEKMIFFPSHNISIHNEFPYTFDTKYYFTRRLLLPQFYSISTNNWFSLLLKLDNNCNNGWEGVIYNDFIYMNHIESNYCFRIYFPIDIKIENAFRVLDIHVYGNTIEGCSIILNSLLILIKKILLNNDINLNNWYIIIPNDKSKQNYYYNYPIHKYNICEFLKNYENKNYNNNDLNIHNIVPEILPIDYKKSTVNCYINNNNNLKIIIKILDIYGNFRYTDDKFTILLISTNGTKNITKETNSNSFPPNIHIYSYNIKEKNINEYILVVTLLQGNKIIYKPILIEGENNEHSQNLLKNWKIYYNYNEIIFNLPFNHEYSRWIEKIKDNENNLLQENIEKDEDYILNLPIKEYLNICKDGCNMAKLIYKEHKKDTFISAHLVQRRFNRYKFEYKKGIKHQIPTRLHTTHKIPIVLPKSTQDLVKPYFLVFERGNILYINIRGTKDTRDKMIDVVAAPSQYSIFKEQKIHKGFHDYSRKLLSILKENYQELLYNKNLKNIMINGHSLGGAMAQIIARYLIDDKNINCKIIVVTMGSPLVGNKEYCNWEGWTNLNNLRIFNFVNQDDFVSGIISKLPILNYGYISDYLYIFEHEKIGLITLPKDEVIPYLTNQKSIMSLHEGDNYIANINACYDILNNIDISKFIVTKNKNKEAD